MQNEDVKIFVLAIKKTNDSEESLVFLKGAAYIAKNLSCSFGRTFSDIDVLVKKQDLPRIEQTLKFSDWLKTEIDDYDEKYYRTWMHEIPPLQHVHRGTILDVHHNILPSTNKNTPDANKFNIEQINVEHVGFVNTLNDFDLVIGLGGLNKVNRFFFEDTLVDFVRDPHNVIFRSKMDFIHHQNSGINHVLCKLANERDIGMFFSLNFVLGENKNKAKEFGLV